MSSSVCHFTSVQYSMPASHNSFLSSIIYKKVQSHYFHHPTNTNTQTELLLVRTQEYQRNYFFAFSFHSTLVSSQLEAHDRTSTHFLFFFHKKCIYNVTVVDFFERVVYYYCQSEIQSEKEEENVHV